MNFEEIVKKNRSAFLYIKKQRLKRTTAVVDFSSYVDGKLYTDNIYLTLDMK